MVAWPFKKPQGKKLTEKVCVLWCPDEAVATQQTFMVCILVATKYKPWP